jgi:hypothetical protein
MTAIVNFDWSGLGKKECAPEDENEEIWPITTHQVAKHCKEVLDK